MESGELDIDVSEGTYSVSTGRLFIPSSVYCCGNTSWPCFDYQAFITQADLGRAHNSARDTYFFRGRVGEVRGIVPSCNQTSTCAAFCRERLGLHCIERPPLSRCWDILLCENLVLSISAIHRNITTIYLVSHSR